MFLPQASQLAQMIKNPPAMQKTWVRPLGRDNPLEKEMATHSRVLAWRISWTEEPGRLQSVGSQRVRHDRDDLACKFLPQGLYTCQSVCLESPPSSLSSSLCSKVPFLGRPSLPAFHKIVTLPVSSPVLTFLEGQSSHEYCVYLLVACLFPGLDIKSRRQVLDFVLC